MKLGCWWVLGSWSKCMQVCACGCVVIYQMSSCLIMYTMKTTKVVYVKTDNIWPSSTQAKYLVLKQRQTACRWTEDTHFSGSWSFLRLKSSNNPTGAPHIHHGGVGAIQGVVIAAVQASPTTQLGYSDYLNPLDACEYKIRPKADITGFIPFFFFSLRSCVFSINRRLLYPTGWLASVQLPHLLNELLLINID